MLKTYLICMVESYLLCFIILNIIIPVYLYDFSLLSHRKADIVIGGIFPIKTSTKISKCNDSRKLICIGRISPGGLHEALAMVYAVYKINKNNNLLPNCTLGVKITDSCDSNEYAIQNCLKFDFVQNIISNGVGFDHNFMYHHSVQSKTVAIVGLRKSTISNSVSTLANLFGIPTVSYGSTDHILSNRERFPTFSRTIPSDKLSAEAISALLRKLEWNIVYTIHDTTDYGISGFSKFQKYLEDSNKSSKNKSSNICIVKEFNVGEVLKHFEEFKKQLLASRDTKAFVCFVHREKASEILQHVFDNELESYTWIFSEGIDFTYEIQKMFKSHLNTSNVVISLQPSSFKYNQTKNIQHTLQDYEKFLEDNFFADDLHDLIPHMKECNEKTCLLDVEFSYFIPYVIDAVNVVAHALNSSGNCCGRNCNGNLNQKEKKPFMQSILEVNFQSALGYDFEFYDNGDVKGQYDILILRESSSPNFQLAGRWKCDTVNSMNLDKSLFHLPISSCNKECNVGEGKISDESKVACCSTCKKCTDDEYSERRTQLCKPCPKFFVPSTNKTSCVELMEVLITFTSSSGISILTTAITGQLLVSFVILVFIKYRDTHIIRASSWEISITMLVGAFLSFTTSYVIIGKISDFSCKLNIIGTGLSLSLMIGSLFVKTNRIYRIFNKDVLRKGLPRYLSKGWQFSIVVFIASCDILISSAVTFNPADPVRYERVVSRSNDATYALCHYSKSASGSWWIFHCCLVAICTYQAVLSRKVPSNYNEARNIMLAMLAITLEMLFVLPSFYFGSVGFYQQMTLALINLVSASSTLVCMHMPKIYIIFFRPSENQESLPHGTLGSFIQMDSVHKEELHGNNDIGKPSHTTSYSVKDQSELHSLSSRNSTPVKCNRNNDRNENGERSMKRRKIKHDNLNISKETTAFPMSKKVAVITT